MKKLLMVLLLVAILMVSATLITIPITRCEDEDPIHVYYAGSIISSSPGPIVWTGPCTATSFTITVRIKWDNPPAKKFNVQWVDVSMTEKTTFGITFMPLSTRLYNPEHGLSPDYCDVVLTVPVAGLPAGTYNVRIYTDTTAQGPEQTPKVSGTDGYFQFVKTYCPPPEATIRGVKFHDRNTDGDRDIGEEGLKDWTIQLFRKVGEEWVPITAATTGDAGDYIFTVTVAGKYRVMEVLKSGWKQTAPAPPGYYEFDVALGDVITGKDFGNKKQYYLTVTDNIGGLSGVSTQSGWYDECTYVGLAAPAYVPVAEGIRYRFDYWDVKLPIHMDANHTANAYYVKQYYLTVQIDPSWLTPAPTPASGWYDECTSVIETAHDVSGYIFVFWDVDGTAVEGNPITVHMDTCRTATAHYWPELEYKQFVTDSKFNVIERFDTVWTPKDQKKTMFKLASTNPGQFMLNIVIHNTWPVAIENVKISFTIDPDFELKGAEPIQVHTGYGKTGTRIYVELGPGIITPPNTPPADAPKYLIISKIEPGETLYITMHLEYAHVRDYFTKAEMLAWKETHPSNTFKCGYAVTVPGPFPFVITNETSTTIYDPIVVLGLED